MTAPTRSRQVASHAPACRRRHRAQRQIFPIDQLTHSPTIGEWPEFARNRRAVASVARCELTFCRKLILRTSTTALRWKKGEGLPIQPGQSNDGAETATTREVERDNLVLSGAVEMTVGAKAQPTRPSKLGNV